MRMTSFGLLFGAIGAAFGVSAAQAEQANTRTADMPYGECLAIIAETAQEMGVEPVVLASTGDGQTVRINAEDGFVTVACNRQDNKMTLSKSSVPKAAGMVASR